MLKTKKLLWSNKHSACTHNASFTVENVLLFGKEAFFIFAEQQNFEWGAENKNNVLSVPRLVKVQNSSTKIVSHRRQIILASKENYWFAIGVLENISN